jgi:hypothetical protein
MKRLLNFVFLTFVFLCVGEALAEENSTLYLVQIRDEVQELNFSEILEAESVAQALSTESISTIYASQAVCSNQIAQMINRYHACSIEITSGLNYLMPNTLSDRMPFLKEFAREAVVKHRGHACVVLMPVSLFREYYKQLHQKHCFLPCFAYAKIRGNSQEFSVVYSVAPHREFRFVRPKN